MCKRAVVAHNALLRSLENILRIVYGTTNINYSNNERHVSEFERRNLPFRLMAAIGTFLIFCHDDYYIVCNNSADLLTEDQLRNRKFQ